MTAGTAIVWFRRDLRLADNPALLTALASAERVIPVFVDAPEDASGWAMGSASRWWLHHSLAALERSLAERGSRLIIRRGEAGAELRRLLAETGARQVFWNRLYEPAAIARDAAIKRLLRETGIDVASFNAALLYEPWEIGRGGGEPYRVFTPFWKAMQARGLEPVPEPAPSSLPPVPPDLVSQPLAELRLLPGIPWDAGFHAHWQAGEAGAWARLEEFLEADIRGYRQRRDLPGEPGTSRLSPHLHFGEISPRQIVSAMRDREVPAADSGAGCYLREIAWREFAHHLLFHFPHTTDAPLDARFAQLPWREDGADEIGRWQRGETGYPVVDAGMRELWRTGWMHNRVRMMAASLLTKNLLVPWQRGARWFWDTLVDADLANNSLGWQWTAGCGADAAPYFRIFNPVLQGERFDPKGEYVRRWVPELARVPDEWLHRPWEAGAERLAGWGIRLGEHYPRPIVDLKLSRERALAAFGALKAPPASV